MTQICVFNTSLVSTHYTLLSATPQGGMFPELFKETQYKIWFKWFKPREHAFKQFKCPVLNVKYQSFGRTFASVFGQSWRRLYRNVSIYSLFKLFYIFLPSSQMSVLFLPRGVNTILPFLYTQVTEMSPMKLPYKCLPSIPSAGFISPYCCLLV